MGLYELAADHANRYYEQRAYQAWLEVVCNHFPPSHATIKFSDEVKKKLGMRTEPGCR